MRRISILCAVALSLRNSPIEGFGVVPPNHARVSRTQLQVSSNSNNDIHSAQHHQVVNRRDALTGAAAFLLFAPNPAHAVYVLDDETGDYVEVEDVDWQTAWKQRLDKASSMSQDEIFQAARGAGNMNLKDNTDESEASKKRRALSGCRDGKVRSAAKAGSERECTSRVLGGETQFILEAL